MNTPPATQPLPPGRPPARSTQANRLPRKSRRIQVAHVEATPGDVRASLEQGGTIPVLTLCGEIRLPRPRAITAVMPVCARCSAVHLEELTAELNRARGAQP